VACARAVAVHARTMPAPMATVLMVRITGSFELLTLWGQILYFNMPWTTTTGHGMLKYKI
jgi:hypothetical protein